MLYLTARAVARANIEHIHRLGAFSGATKCQYHYGGSAQTHCAIGVVDVDRKLTGNASLAILIRRRVIDYSDDDALVPWY